MTQSNGEHNRQKGVWFDSLFHLIQEDGGQQNRSVQERLAEKCVRVMIVVRARWVMLSLLFLYSVLAEFVLSPTFDLPMFHFEGRGAQFYIIAFAFMLTYTFLSVPCRFVRTGSCLIYAQVLVDILFVTTVIHFSGGIVSWFWPAYMLVTLSAAFLFDKKREVWGIGAIGATLYGFLLMMEHLGVLSPVEMPFTEIHKSSVLLEALMWLWVAGMNAVVAVFGAFLMGKIRADHRKVQEGEEALLGFISSTHDLIFCCECDGRLLYLNHVGLSLLDVSTDELGLISVLDLTDEEGKANLFHHFEKLCSGSDLGHFELRLETRKGRVVDVDVSLSSTKPDPDSDQVIWGVCHDITERNKAQRELLKLAHHDMLTGLPNRILLHDRLQQIKAFAHRSGSRFALVFLDLDRFKIINDTLGHAVGDELLKQIAKRLKESLRETDTVARIGGDEFIVLLVNESSRADVEVSAKKLLKGLSDPFYVRGHELFVTTSAGVCIYPDDEEDVEMMMQKADIAMYHAKSMGRNNYKLYRAGMDENTSRRFIIANSLKKALDNQQFRLYYQPKVDVVSGRIVSMEALIRWAHPELGTLSPTEFIPMAEENGMIMEIGAWVLREACRQNVVWHGCGMHGLRVAVNLSGYQLQQANLIDHIRSVLDETGMTGDSLEFEITESVIMQNPDYVVNVLNEITGLGIHISIDDFGTGYSSLSHLQRFTVNTLKIDKAFVRDVEKSTTDAAIASAIISMGSKLRLKVIAEGVETQEQMDFLRENNCDQVQGFLISKPVPPEEALELLRENWASVPRPA